MPARWFSSDQHFFHQRIPELAGRPFGSVEEMHEVLIGNHNRRVAPDDEVWFLGDYAFGDLANLAITARLNGRKRLITGNHDKAWVGHSNGWKHLAAYHEAGFEVVTPWAWIQMGGRRIMLSHFPYTGDHTETDRFTAYRLRDEGRWLLHGHVHEAWKVDAENRQINVGVDAWDFAPVQDHTLIEIINEADPK